MIECVFISVGTVFGILGIIKLIQQIHKAIFIDRVPRWDLESAMDSAKQYEGWYKERGASIDRLCSELELLKTAKKK